MEEMSLVGRDGIGMGLKMLPLTKFYYYNKLLYHFEMFNSIIN
jgi:hypothetical protein